MGDAPHQLALAGGRAEADILLLGGAALQGRQEKRAERRSAEPSGSNQAERWRGGGRMSAGARGRLQSAASRRLKHPRALSWLGQPPSGAAWHGRRLLAAMRAPWEPS